MDDDCIERTPPPDAEFRPPPLVPRLGTYILLFFLLVIWPATGLLFLFTDRDLNLDLFDPVLFIYVPTIIIEWLLFAAVIMAVRYEKSPFRSVGFNRPKWSYLPLAAGFLIASNTILMGLQFLLERMGLPVDKAVDQIVARAGESVWWWMAVSVTAAVCEETCFRGYILSRVKHMTGKGWSLPVMLATISFAAGHTYQGWGGCILIFVYGLMFCWLYVKTGSLWPGIAVHFVQDFAAIFLYRWFGF